MTTNRQLPTLPKPSKISAIKRQETPRFKLTNYEKANPLSRKQISELFGPKKNDIEGALYLQKRHMRFLARQQ
ncbi:MAG: hypothetical protein MK137_09990 [Rickettsiales bacterium]|nr:hypothetical protein [Rickettsiales bacterium]